MQTDSREKQSLLQRLMRYRMVHNIVALFGTQIARYVFPLIVIPYLARILGPTQWGIVALAQALGMYYMMVVDFGFQLSATRRIARAHGDEQKMEVILAGVLGAKIVLSVFCLLSLAVLQLVVPAFKAHGLIMCEGAISGIASGFSMLWFYQGIEDMKTSSAIDVAGRAISAGGIFLFVHTKNDAWRVLAVQAFGFTVITVWMLILAYRRVRFVWPTRSTTIEALRESASMFLFSGALSLYTTANTLILGMVASPYSVGLFAGAEKLMRAMAGVLLPFSQSIYPRINKLMLTSTQKAIHLSRLSLAGMGAIGLLMGGGTYYFAPLIVHLALGDKFGGSIAVLRTLGLLLPILAVSNVLGMQWMLPLGMDRVFNTIIISAGLLNIGLGFWWATRWQHTGMAWAVLCSELLVATSMIGVLVRKKIAPWSSEEDLIPQLQMRTADH